MELPFAVESSLENASVQHSSLDGSSLVTASSQGSLTPVETASQPIPLKASNDQGFFSSFSKSSSKVSAVLSHFGVVGTKPSASTEYPVQETETIDFTYVNVCETDAEEVDIVIPGVTEGHEDESSSSSDILSFLLSGAIHENPESQELVELCEEAYDYMNKALDAKKAGRLQGALDAHTTAAKLFRQAAAGVKEKNHIMAHSLLLLSQTQAKSALAMKRVIHVRPHLAELLEGSVSRNSTPKERLRATVRGALNNQTEADISDSTFLGRAVVDDPKSPSVVSSEKETTTLQSTQSTAQDANPVDEMMELERELRDMDMALELGNSIASLDVRTQNRMKSSGMVDGSFMVVPPGSNSYMSSSTVWSGTSSSTALRAQPLASGGVRARTNRVRAPLDASWWGNASQVLSSSVISLANPGDVPSQAGTKQLMRLMDALKTLGDENATLLRELEGAETARMEAKAAKEEMRRFKDEYGKRFAALKAALEKFRQGYPDQNVEAANPVTSSEYVQRNVKSDQIQRQEQLLRKLTADLQKEKEESKKKDAALRKYESFYREVKARSAQKAAQRQKQERMLSTGTGRGPLK